MKTTTQFTHTLTHTQLNYQFKYLIINSFCDNMQRYGNVFKDPMDSIIDDENEYSINPEVAASLVRTKKIHSLLFNFFLFDC